jgi:hypothetical protein
MQLQFTASCSIAVVDVALNSVMEYWTGVDWRTHVVRLVTWWFLVASTARRTRMVYVMDIVMSDCLPQRKVKMGWPIGAVFIER